MEIRDTSSMRLDASVGVLSCYCCFRARGTSRAHEYLYFSAWLRLYPFLPRSDSIPFRHRIEILGS